MSKRPDIGSVTTGFRSQTRINDDLTALQEGFDNTLSRDGSTPNEMLADLDLNGNDILNVGTVNTSSFRINGELVVPTDTVFVDLGFETDIKYEYKSIADMVADTRSYTFFANGDVVRAGGHLYDVVATGATDNHLISAGTVKFRVKLVGSTLQFRAFDPDTGGTTSVTTKLQQAIDMLEAAGGGTLLVGTGTFRISTQVNLKSSVRLNGYGATVTLGANGIIMFNGTSVNDVSVVGFKVTNPSSHTTGNFVNLTSTLRCEVSQNYILGLPSSNNGTIRIFGSGNSRYNVVRDNVLEDSVGNAICVIGTNATRNWVEKNTIDNSGGFGVFIAGNSSYNTVARNRTLSSNDLELIGVAVGSNHNIIESNHAQGCGDNGISITGNYNVVTGNHCYDNDLSGIHLYGSFNACTANICLRNGQASASRAGIAVQPAFGGSGQNNLIVGNTCDDDQAVPTQNNSARILATSYSAWASGVSVTAGDYRTNGIRIYKATTTGTTGATAPTHTSGTVSDGAVSWEEINFFRTSAETRGNILTSNKFGISVSDEIFNQQDAELEPLTVQYSSFQFLGGITMTRRVTEASTTVTSADYLIGVRSTSAWTITLPATTNLTTGRTIVISDETGQANVNNITISGNGNNIEGSATSVINTAYGSRTVYWTGTQWITI